MRFIQPARVGVPKSNQCRVKIITFGLLTVRTLPSAMCMRNGTNGSFNRSFSIASAFICVFPLARARLLLHDLADALLRDRFLRGSFLGRAAGNADTGRSALELLGALVLRTKFAHDLADLPDLIVGDRLQ